MTKSIIREKGGETDGGKREEEGRKVLLGEQQQPCSVLQVFSSPSLRFSPPPASLIVVTLTERNVLPVLCQERAEGGRKRNSSGSLTHFSIPPTRFSFPPHCLCVCPRRQTGVEEWRVFKRLQESYEDQQRCHVLGMFAEAPL